MCLITFFCHRHLVMAEWNDRSTINRGGHPNTSHFSQGGMRDDPTNLRYPIQETGYEETEGDGSPSIQIGSPFPPNGPVETPRTIERAIQNEVGQANEGLRYNRQHFFHDQSVSGFSNNAMNIPSNGHLQQLPTIDSRQFAQNSVTAAVEPITTHFEAMLRQHLGADMYESMKRECYISHLTAGRNREESRSFASHLIFCGASVMCRICNERQLSLQSPLQHKITCPVWECLQTIASMAANQSGTHQQLHPRPEHGEVPRETEYFTAYESEQQIDRESFLTVAQTRNCDVRQNLLEPVKGPQRREVRHMAHPKYSNINERYRTFDSWPSSSKQKPKELSKAGLYYLGTRDHCRCFYCGGLLRDWEDDDDPLVEHEKWFPNCPYACSLMKARKAEQEAHRVTEAFGNLSVHANSGRESYTLPAELNPDICAVCCKNNIAVTQLYCRHIVCRDCVPAPDQSDGKFYCNICRKEVAKTVAIDGNCPRRN